MVLLFPVFRSYSLSGSPYVVVFIVTVDIDSYFFYVPNL